MANADKSSNSGDEAASQKKKGKGKLLILAALILLASAGGATWYFLVHKKADATEAKPATLKIEPVVYLPLENLVINLADPGGDRFAQAGITFKLRDEKSMEEVKKLLPSIRNSILLVLSQRRAEDLLSREGKEKLAADILMEVSKVLGVYEPEEASSSEPGASKQAKKSESKKAPNPVIEILFSSLIVQ